MSEYVKFKISEELKNLQDEVFKKISKSGKIKIGINEVTKAIERGTAKLIAIAEDVSPAEIVMHLPVIAKEKKIPFTYFKTKTDLGKAVGISAKASSIAIIDAGVSQKELSSLISKISDMVGGEKAPKAEVKKDAPKVEVKTETPKAEAKTETPKVEAKTETPKVEVDDNKSKDGIKK